MPLRRRKVECPNSPTGKHHFVTHDHRDHGNKEAVPIFYCKHCGRVKKHW